MAPHKIFISSVQSEFTEERAALREHVLRDKAWRKYFEVFVFEAGTAKDTMPKEHYLRNVDDCEIYVGLLGRTYGSEDHTGLSPVEQEFQRATERGKRRLIFLKKMTMEERDPKMRALVERVQRDLARKTFSNTEELLHAFEEALDEFIDERFAEREKFADAPCGNATRNDLDPKKMRRYVHVARATKKLSLPANTAPPALLKHLDLLKDNKPTNAAVLLFGRAPQRFLFNSSVKCASSHATQVTKPLISHQIYDGTVFELLDQALGFVLDKIDRAIGKRTENAHAPRTYEIPPEVVSEAIVNALVHRDYTSTGSIELTVFPDRVEIMNPGGLLPPLTLSDLRTSHGSFPRNPSLFRALRHTPLVEEFGTGTLDMIRRCVDAELPEPEFESSGTFTVRIWRAANRVCEVAVLQDSKPAEGMDVLILSSDGEHSKLSTGEDGKAFFETRASHLARTVFVAGYGRTACVRHSWIPGKAPLSLRTHELAEGGSVIFRHGSGHLPGLPGRLSIDYERGNIGKFSRTEIDADNGEGIAGAFHLGDWFYIIDSQGANLQVRVVETAGNSVLLEFQALKSAMPQPASLERRLLLALSGGPMSRSELAAHLGQTSRTGQLSKALRHLLGDSLIEFTLPEKPRSHNQRYRLTPRGRHVLGEFKK